MKEQRSSRSERAQQNDALLPEEVRTAVYWLNVAGRSLIADQLALWVESKVSFRLDDGFGEKLKRLADRLMATTKFQQDAHTVLEAGVMIMRALERIADTEAKLEAVSEVLGHPKGAWKIAGCDVLAHYVRDLQNNYIALRDAPRSERGFTISGEAVRLAKGIATRRAADASERECAAEDYFDYIVAKELLRLAEHFDKSGRARSKVRMTRAQREWCKQYEASTTFEPLMDDFLAGNDSFLVAAKRSRDWFESWMNDAFRGIPNVPGEE